MLIWIIFKVLLSHNYMLIYKLGCLIFALIYSRLLFRHILLTFAAIIKTVLVITLIGMHLNVLAL